MDNSEFNKATNKPKFFSEFSMGELDFKRFDHWLQKVEMSSGVINSTALPILEMCQDYFAGLNVLYKLWRPIISVKDVKEALDGKIAEAKGLKRRWEGSVKLGSHISKVTILELVDILDGIHTKLMEIKQSIGLGIAVRRSYDTHERIKEGMVSKKIYSLPEK